MCIYMYINIYVCIYIYIYHHYILYIIYGPVDIICAYILSIFKSLKETPCFQSHASMNLMQQPRNMCGDWGVVRSAVGREVQHGLLTRQWQHPQPNRKELHGCNILTQRPSTPLPCSPKTFWRKPFWRQTFRHMLSLALSPWVSMKQLGYSRYCKSGTWIVQVFPYNVEYPIRSYSFSPCPLILSSSLLAEISNLLLLSGLVLTWDGILTTLHYFAMTLLALLKLKLPGAVWMERMVRFSDPSPEFLSAYCGRSRPGLNAKNTSKSQPKWRSKGRHGP